MWWLSFRLGGVVVIGASSLVHARLLAAQNGLGRASHFVEGHFIDPARIAPIRPEYVGRMLSPIEARQLMELLNYEPGEHGTERGPETAPRSSRRRG
jgi:hypothetical protein